MLQKRKVLMVYCYAKATQGKLRDVGGAHPPIGLLYTAASIEKTGHNVKVSDELVNDDTEKMIEDEVILPKLLNKNDWSKIKGITYKNNKGEIINNGKSDLIEDLDKIPFPARHLIDFSKYAGTAEFGFLLHKNEKWTPVITSRGCPYLCTFCANWRVMGRDTRDRSPENVLEELKEIKYTNGMNTILFLDDTFTLRPKRVEKICELMIKENLNMKWSCQTRVDVSKELLELMKKAGCQLVAFGVESGSNKVLRAIKKGTNIDIVKNAFKISHEVGLKRKAFFI